LENIMTPDATPWAKANLEIYRNVAKSPREIGTRFQETAQWETEISQAARATTDVLTSLKETPRCTTERSTPFSCRR